MTAGETAVLELAILFTDPDGDALAYGTTSSNASVATVSVSGSALTVSAIAAGTMTITATANRSRWTLRLGERDDHGHTGEPGTYGGALRTGANDDGQGDGRT